MRRLFWVGAGGALALALAFLMLPLVAIFLRVPPGDLLTRLDDPVTVDALLVTLRTTLIANVIIVVVGTPAAYVLGRRRFRGRSVALTLVELPLVLPPAVAGIALLAAFGRAGLLGQELSALGVTIPFTQAAVVMAVVFVAGPFYLRQGVAAFEAVDPAALDAARTLGASPARVFARVALPLAASGLAAGWALAFARGVGEFGATIIFAGSIEAVTQTLPLAVYAEFDRDFDAALAIGALLLLVSGAVLLAVKLIPQWARTASSSTSGSRSGA